MVSSGFQHGEGIMALIRADVLQMYIATVNIYQRGSVSRRVFYFSIYNDRFYGYSIFNPPRPWQRGLFLTGPRSGVSECARRHQPEPDDTIPSVQIVPSPAGACDIIPEQQPADSRRV